MSRLAGKVAPVTSAARGQGRAHAPAMARAARHRHAFGGLIDPAQISGAVVFLASDEASRITGIAMPVDSGHPALSTFNPAPPQEDPCAHAV